MSQLPINYIGDGFLSLVFPSIFLALSGASTVGPKRLASTTYKYLNSCIIFDSIIYLTSIIKPFHLSAYVFFSILEISVASVGLYKGMNYSEKKIEKIN